MLGSFQWLINWEKELCLIGNEISIETWERTKIFLDEVDKYFLFLNEYNYRLKEIRLASEYVVENIIEVSYENKKLNRLIIVHFEPNDIYGNEVDFVSISLFKDILHRKKELVFKKYLNKYRSELEIGHLSYPNKNNKASFEENMQVSISGFSYFLSDVGHDLINGKEWEDGLVYDWFVMGDIFNISQKECIYIKDLEEIEDTIRGEN